eukprot:6464927-Amphidinium_carterae.1
MTNKKAIIVHSKTQTQDIVGECQDIDAMMAMIILKCWLWGSSPRYAIGLDASPPQHALQAAPQDRIHARARMQAASFKQAYRHTPPSLITEFGSVVKVAACPSEVDSYKVLRTEAKEGEEGAKTHVIGMFRKPAQFIEEALCTGHPFDWHAVLPDILQRPILHTPQYATQGSGREDRDLHQEN